MTSSPPYTAHPVKNNKEETNMASPIDILFAPITLICAGIYGALMLWEFLSPARKLPTVRGWQLSGVAAFVGYILLSNYFPLLWSDVLADLQPWSLAELPLWLQVLCGLLAYEFGLYWWHRSLHGSNLLWRFFHQMHHSAERLDTFSAFWFSPLDILGFAFIGSLALSFMGIGSEAAVIVLYITLFLAVFQHTNVRTPHWLGFFVQRPESHSQHHRRGQHRYNYADLPVFDIIFGTFRNPLHHYDVGFYPGSAYELPKMWLGRDISSPSAVKERALVLE